MDNVINILMGDIVVSTNPDASITTFVGSCIALCMYEHVTKIAGMAHIALATCNNKKCSDTDKGKYADLAIDNLIKLMSEKGVNGRSLKVKIAGGAQIFSYAGKDCFDIGDKNIAAVKRILGSKGIEIVGEDIGGKYGRHVTFKVNSFDVTIRNTKGEVKRI